MLSQWKDQDGPYSGPSSLHEEVSKPYGKEQNPRKEFLGHSCWVPPLNAGDTTATETGKVTVLLSLHNLGWRQSVYN